VNRDTKNIKALILNKLVINPITKLLTGLKDSDEFKEGSSECLSIITLK
jgi:hypothetical protein